MADCHSLVACTPPGYSCFERASLRPTAQATNMRTNHGDCCLLCLAKCSARAVPFPVCKTFEVLGVYLRGARLNNLAIFVYRAGSSSINSSFCLTNLITASNAPPSSPHRLLFSVISLSIWMLPTTDILRRSDARSRATTSCNT